ncbi:MAG TPA: RHS repeat-associated core domain-containing protein [Leptospiraceae bacterium]|nr:RHS repeat-associated core domain-containing protein [Leptospiraceae bacterium]
MMVAIYPAKRAHWNLLYYPKEFNFSKFMLQADGSWLSIDKAGNKYYFGVSYGVKTTETDPLRNDKIKIWPLEKVEDIYKNGYSITYLTADSKSDGYPYPDKITYNNGNTIIQFAYVTRSTNDTIELYRYASKQKITKRLDSITVTNNGSVIETYTLGYELGATSNSRLMSINRDGYKPISFSYNDNTIDVNGITTSTSEVGSLNYTYSFPERNPCLIGEAACGCSAACAPPLNVIAGVICAFNYRAFKNYCRLGIENSIHLFADVTGDGVPELLAVTGSNSNVQIKSSVAGTSLQSDYFNLSGNGMIIPGDINGDGKTDFFIFEDNDKPLKVAKVNTNLSMPVTTLGINVSKIRNDPGDKATKNFIVDFNADGRSDYIQFDSTDSKLKVYLSDGNALIIPPPKKVLTLEQSEYGKFGQAFMDMDRNGIPDFVRMDNTNSKYRIIVTFYKQDLTKASETISTFTDLGEPGNQFFADVNGDGFIDFVIYDGANLQVYLFDGMQFKTTPMISPIENVVATKDPGFDSPDIGLPGQGAENGYIDLSGDGIPDKVEHDGVHIKMGIYNSTLGKYDPTVGIGGSPFSVDINKDGAQDVLVHTTRTMTDDNGKDHIFITFKVTLYDKDGNRIKEINPPEVDIGNLYPKARQTQMVGPRVYDNWRNTKMFVDMNQDGKADFVRFYNGRVYISYFKNVAGNVVYTKGGDISFPAAAFQYVADMNKDGRLDIVGVDVAQSPIQYGFDNSDYKNESARAGNGTLNLYHLPKSPAGDLLTKAYDAQKSISINYGNDQKFDNDSYPVLNHQSTTDRIVNSLDIDYGGRNKEWRTYSFYDHKYYIGASIDKTKDLGYKMQGILSMKSSPYETKKIYEENRYNQLDAANLPYFPGTLKQNTTYFPNNILEKLVDTETSYTTKPAIAGNTFIAPTSQTITSQDGFTPSISKITEYDIYGNVTVQSETQGTEKNKVINDYEVDTTKWILNRANRATKKINNVVMEDKKVIYSDIYISEIQSLVDPEKQIWSKTKFSDYDTHGNARTITDNKGNVLTLVYDDFANRYVVTATPSMPGHSVTKTYNYNNGEEATVTNAFGTLTKEYDKYGRLAIVRYPGVSSNSWSEQYFYNLNDPLNAFVERKINDGSASGLWAREWTNTIGHKYRKETKASVGQNSDTSMIEEKYYDLFGRLTKEAKAYWSSNSPIYKTYDYSDPLGRLSRVTHEDGSTTDMGYSGFNTTITTTGKASDGTFKITNTTEVFATQRGKVTKKIVNGLATSYDENFDSKGRYVKITAADGSQTLDRYNLKGDKLSHTDSNSGLTTYEYDPNGNLIKQTGANAGSIIQYEYDPLDRVTKIDKPGFETDTILKYDENNKFGKLTSVILKEYRQDVGLWKDAVVSTYDYDAIGRLSSLKKEVDDLKLIFRYQYDILNRVNKVTYPNQVSLNYNYATSGYVQSISMDKGNDIGNEVVAYAVTPEFVLQRLTGNNVNTLISYDAATKRPKDVVTKLNLTDAVQKWHYEYDHSGNILKITDLIAGGNSQTYEYDKYNRITSATGLYGMDKKQATETYEYTDGGRLTHKANLDLFYEDPNHIHATTRAKVKTILNTTYDVNYKYDDAGNMVQRDDEIFKYDSENKLTQVDKTVGDTVNYLYEHTGNRIRKSRTSTNEAVYNINGVYEVTKIPNLSDRHTLYIRGIKEELVAQYTASDVVLLTESNPTNENKAGIALLIGSFRNTLDQTRIRFAKWVTRTQANNPFALKLYMVYAILFCIFLYAVISSDIVTRMVRQAHHDNTVILSLSKDTNNTDKSTGLRLVSLLLIVSVSFVFSTCSPKALTGGNRPAPPPYWLFAAFSSEPESPSVSTDNSNNPGSGSSGGGNTQVTTSSGNGNTSTPPTSGGNSQTGSTSSGSGGGTLSAGTPRLGMFFFHPDHTGSISMVTDGAGRMMTDTSGASQLTYKPYGEVNRMNSYGPDIFRYKYTSQQDDQDTGLYYYNARYYDPVLGSFTSADNVTNATSSFGLNHYMYTEGNPVRYGDTTGNFLGPLLYAGFHFAVCSAAAIAIGSAAVAVGATIAIGMAVVNTLATTAAMAQTAAIATATFLATTLVAAVRFALFVNALGTIGAGIGFVAGGLDTGTLQGALAGAEIGFKIGTAIQIAVNIAVGGYYLSGTLAPGESVMAKGGFAETWTNSIFSKIFSPGVIAADALYLVSIGKFILEVAIISIYGQIVKAVGREAGGHLNPENKGFGYDRDSAYRGEAAAGFINTASQTFRGILDATEGTPFIYRQWSNASLLRNSEWLIGIIPLEVSKALIISESIRYATR